MTLWLLRVRGSITHRHMTLDRVITGSHVTNFGRYILSFTESITNKLDRVVAKVDRFSPLGHMTPFSCGHVTSHYKSKTYLVLKTYDHETFKDRGIGREATGSQAILTFNFKVKFQMKNSDKHSGFSARL